VPSRWLLEVHHGPGRACVVKDLRSSQRETVRQSAAARATLEAARDKAIEIKRFAWQPMAER
jgi:hypothetical protein